MDYRERGSHARGVHPTQGSRIFARRTSAHPDTYPVTIFLFFHVILLLVLAFLCTLFLFLFSISTLQQGYKSLRTLLHSPNLT